MLKTNPLLKLNGMGGDFFHDSDMPDDRGEHTEDNLDSPSHNNHMNTHKVSNLFDFVGCILPYMFLIKHYY